MSKHTATPWKLHHKAETAIVGATGFVVAACGGHDDNTRNRDDLWNELRANAAHIVRCVNTHAQLVEALENLLATDLTGDQLSNRIAAARRALAAAKGAA